MGTVIGGFPTQSYRLSDPSQCLEAFKNGFIDEDEFKENYIPISTIKSNPFIKEINLLSVKYVCETKNTEFVISFALINKERNLFKVEFHKYGDEFTIYLVSIGVEQPSHEKVDEILSAYKASKTEGKSYHFDYETLEKIESVYNF